MFDEPLFGAVPEPLHVVVIDPAGGKVLLILHLKMPVAAEHEAVLTIAIVVAISTKP